MKDNNINRFISAEAASGVFLLLTLVLALICANTSLKSFYDLFLDMPIKIGIGPFVAEKPALLWVNEGLMAIFFMLLALEVKREVKAGELSKPSQLVLPIVGAIGGILLPILIYFLLNHGDALKMQGWPIATTTDIAFALSVIALLGKKVPSSLKIMLVTLSIVDDILAVIIIAAFYTDSLSMLSMMLSLVGFVVLLLLNLFKVERIAAYMIVGAFMWVFVVKSGVHATLAGVVIGLLIPYDSKKGIDHSPLLNLEKSLHPWVAFAILPLFVFMNGGISFAGFTFHTLFSSVPLGVALGLFVGKTLGSFFLCWLVIKFKWANLPAGAKFPQLFALLALTGIGFTMSLFISSLAFNATPYEEVARQGVLVGSIFSCALGVILFNLIKR